MRSCPYCGRDNQQSAAQCHECGTELNAPVVSQSEVGPSWRALVRQPAYLAWLAAVVVLLQAFIRLGLSPYDPRLGEGNVERVEAATWMWGSIAVAVVLASLGWYLRSRRKGHHAA